MVTRITKTKPTGGAKLRRPNGDTYLELPDTPYDPSDEDETRTIDTKTGYFGKKIS